MTLGHRSKSPAQLAWNAIKKAVNARVNLECAIYRERRTNELLDELWPQFEAALNRGEILELEAAAEQIVEAAQGGPGAA